MDEKLLFNGITFVWNKAKAQSNLNKHGVTFEQASQAFFDPFFRLLEAGVETESREAIIGMDDGWNLLFVVHAVLLDERIRIISARRATAGERQYYED